MELEALPLDELPDGSMRLVPAGRDTIGLYRCGGELYAIEDRCTHDDGPLCEGEWEQEACVVVCRTRKTAHRRGKVLLVDAVGEVTRERANSSCHVGLPASDSRTAIWLRKRPATFAISGRKLRRFVGARKTT